MQEPSLTKDPIPKLIKSLAVPASIGFFFNTMYNVVDTYWAGQISTLGQAALAISFPVFFIIIAIGYGLSSGTTALIGNELGSENRDKAAHYGVQSISFAIILGVLIPVIGFILSPWLFGLLGAEGEYLNLALRYINVVFLGSIFFTLVFSANGILNAVGDTKPYRNFLIAGFFLNIILSPMFLFGWGPLPAMGIGGIALATILIEAIGAVYLLLRVRKINFMSVGIRKNLKPKPEFFKDIAKQGVPSSVHMMTVALGIFILTFFIGKYGEAAVAAYGIAVRVEQIILVPMIGINISVLSIVAQNKGAGLIERIREVLRLSYRYSAAMMAVGLVVLVALAPWLMKLFNTDPEVVKAGALYLRIEAFALFGYTIVFISDAVYQAYKKPMIPLAFGLARQIIAPVILFALMVFVFKTPLLGIWLSVFAIIWTSALIYLFMVRRLVRKDLKETGS